MEKVQEGLQADSLKEKTGIKHGTDRQFRWLSLPFESSCVILHIMDTRYLQIRYMTLMIGVYLGVALFMCLDGTISVFQIHTNDSSPWPANMHPWIRVYFFPIFGTILAAGVTVVEITRSNIWGERVMPLTHWLMLGGSYTSFLSLFVLGHIFPVSFACMISVGIVLTVNPITVPYYLNRKINHQKG